MSLYTILLVLHITAGSFCLLTGAINFFVKKRKGKHTTIGKWYHSGYFIIFLSSVGMALMNWSESAYLFYIAFFSYGFALFGYIAGKKQSTNWLAKHIAGMAGSYIGIVTAVLVVNGMDIPLIREIPILLLWFLPTIIGTPIIFIVNARYQTVAKLKESLK